MNQPFFTALIFIGFVILFSSCQNQNNSIENQVKNQTANTEEELEGRDNIETTETEMPIDKDYFKKFDKIELAYYPHSQRSYGIMPNCSKLIKNGVFEVDSLQKKVVLNEIQIKEFENLVFIPLEESDSLSMSSDCFRPRHSLIFYEKEKATHIVEICFECQGICNSFSVNVGNLYFRFEEMENLFNQILKK